MTCRVPCRQLLIRTYGCTVDAPQLQRASKNESNLFQFYHLDKELESGREAVKQMTVELGHLKEAHEQAERDIVVVKKDQQAAVKESIMVERKVEKQRMLLEEQVCKQ